MLLCLFRRTSIQFSQQHPRKFMQFQQARYTFLCIPCFRFFLCLTFKPLARCHLFCPFSKAVFIFGQRKCKRAPPPCVRSGPARAFEGRRGQRYSFYSFVREQPLPCAKQSKGALCRNKEHQAFHTFLRK